MFPEYILSPSISAARNFVRRGCVHVEGVEAVCASSVQPGDRVQVMQPTRSVVTNLGEDPNRTPLQVRDQETLPAPHGLSNGGIATVYWNRAMRNVSLWVVYEDACMAGVVKPQGLPMHGKETEPSVLSGLSHVLKPTLAVGALPRPQHVHRLDLPTGGLVLVAKTRAAQ
eukprot:1759404-Pyramimonas_sp.AAC.1